VASLVSRLRAQEADPNELSELLLNHLGHARGIGERTVQYGSHNGAPGLTVKYDRKGVIREIEPDEGLRDSEVDAIRAKIETNLLTPGPVMVARAPFFTKVATDGWHRFADRFLIRDVPPGAPRPPMGWGWHPFLVEVKFVSSNNPQTNLGRRSRALREIELLLAGLLVMDVRRSSNNAANQHWVMDRSDPAKMKSVLAQEYYGWEGFAPEASEFSDTSGVTPLATADYQAYYARYNYSITDRLDIPDTLPWVLGEYFALDLASQMQFQRAAYWYQYAKESWERSQSGAYVAFVSAIEALKEPEREEATRCESCGQRTGKSATARFTDLLDTLVPVSGVAEEDRRQYFRLRSALTHGDKLFQNDITLWPMNMSSWDESGALRSLSRIVQAGLYNWLLARAITRVVRPPETV
jgi:hypothetical protein